MRIITISREFGSGGRELGKRLADALGVPCYDQQIIDMIAQKKNLDKNYIAHVCSRGVLRGVRALCVSVYAKLWCYSASG